MGLLYGDTGRTSVGSLKRFDVSYPTPFEDNIALSPEGLWVENLPTSQVTGILIDYIITESDLPVITPNVPCQYTAFCTAGGYNYSGATAVVNYIWYLNDVMVSGSSGNMSINTSSRNWMNNMYRFKNITVGDKISVLLWANSTGVSFEYKAMYVIPTSIQIMKKGTLVKDLNIGGNANILLTKNWTSPYDGLTHGNLSPPNVSSVVLHLSTSNSTNYFAVNSNVSAVGYTFPSYGAVLDHQISANLGDISLSNANYMHSSLKYYVQPRCPLYYQFRELAI